MRQPFKFGEVLYWVLEGFYFLSDFIIYPKPEMYLKSGNDFGKSYETLL